MTYPFISIYRKTASPIIILPCPRAEKSVFVNYQTDRDIAARFIEAVQDNPEDAWAFVSKLYAGGLDLNALREVLLPAPGMHLCKWVNKAEPTNTSRHFKTRSLYIADTERNLRSLLHLRMVKEPDKNGLWKICAVEQEECPRGV